MIKKTVYLDDSELNTLLKLMDVDSEDCEMFYPGCLQDNYLFNLFDDNYNLCGYVIATENYLNEWCSNLKVIIVYGDVVNDTDIQKLYGKFVDNYNAYLDEEEAA